MPGKALTLTDKLRAITHLWEVDERKTAFLSNEICIVIWFSKKVISIWSFILYQYFSNVCLQSILTAFSGSNSFGGRSNHSNLPCFICNTKESFLCIKVHSHLLLLPVACQLPFLQIVFPSAVFIQIATFLQGGDKAVYFVGFTQTLVNLTGLFSRKENSVYLEMPAFIQDEQIHSNNESLMPFSHCLFW